MKKVLILLLLTIATGMFALLNAVDLSEGFESASFPPDGWRVINGGDQNTWELTNERSHTGSYSAIINYGEYAHDDWLISRKLAPTAGNHSYIFWAANYHSVFPDAFNVLLSTTGNEIADFTVTLGSNLVPDTEFQEYSFDLNAYVGQTVYVAIQAISTDMYRLYIDDVSGSPLALEAEPSNHVTNITASQNGNDAITVSWTGSTGNQLPGKYLVMVKNTDDSYASVADGTPVSEDNNWSDGNLAKNIAHTAGTNTCTFSGFSLGDVCSVIIYPYTNYGENINFLTTAPVPEISITITSGGLIEGFEGSSFPPDGWTVINGGDPNTWELSDVIPHSGSYSASILFNGAAHNDWLISHRLAPSASNYTYSFWAVNEDMEYPEAFNLKLSTTGRAMADFTVTLGSNLVPGSAFQYYSYDLSAYVGQNVYVAIQSFSQDMWRLVVDDISGPPLAFETQPSSHVTDFTARQISNDAISLNWTGSTGAQLPGEYLILIKNTGGSYANVADGTTVSEDTNWTDGNLARIVTHAAGTNSITMSGFSTGDVCSIIIYPYTNYGTDINYLTAAPVPETSVTMVNLWFTEGFEGVSFPPAGWTVINAGGSNAWYQSDHWVRSGLYCSALNSDTVAHNDWLISPQLAPNATSHSYEFWSQNLSGSNRGAFNVKLSTTGNNQADFTVTLGSNLVPTISYQRFSYDLNAYIGQAVYVAIQAISQGGQQLLIDDVSGPHFASEVAPPDPATPVDPVDFATDIILHPTLTWAAGSANSDAYKLYLGTDGNGTTRPTNVFNNLNMGANLSYYCTTLLTPNTVYYWQIVPYNAGGNAADCPIWSFTTTGPEVIAGNCLEFDGTDDNITGTGISTALSAFTIETWVYHNSLPGTVQRYVTLAPEMAVLRYDGTIYGGYRSLHFYITKANGTGLGVRADSVLVTGEWMHIAGTYDGTNLKLYVNGTLVKSAVSAGAGLYAPSGVYSFSYSGETLNGKLDEIRIWNYARSATQIRESRHHSLSGTASGLLHYWQFNKSMGTTATDVKGGCDGTLNNMTDEDWIVSTTPLGTGISYTRTEATGLVSFTGTDLSINYTAHNSATVTVSKLNTNPNYNPTDINTVFYNQYWIVSRYGTGSFNGNMTLTVSEDLSADDQLHPNQIRLYYRSSGSEGSWTALTAAISVDASLNQATFSGISETGQFLVCRDYPATSNQIGTALAFNGSDEYLNVGNSSSLDVGNVLTVEAWVKPNSVSAREGIFSTRLNNAAGSFQFELGTGSAGTGRVAVSGVSTWVAQTGDNAIANGEWVHLAYTRSGSAAGTSNIYINGVQQTLINNIAYTFVNNTGDKVLGSGTSGGQFFNGNMDEVRVWNIARTADQIRESMYLSLVGTETGLVSYWQCNEAAGTLAQDNISTNNGAMLNMDNANWVTSPLPFASGVANSQTEAAGTVTFTGTGLSAFYTSAGGARVTVAKLNCSPNILPTGVLSVYDDQYWEMNRFGTGSFAADLTLTLNEDLTNANQETPGEIKLYQRSSTSNASWLFVTSASSVDAALNTATFNGITATGQFIAAYNPSRALRVTPTSITQSIDFEGNASLPMSIENVGGSPISYTVSVNAGTGASGTASRGSGAPGDNTYAWIDSDQAGGPAFNWVEISSPENEIITNNVIDYGNFDDGYKLMPLPFAFPFFDSTYTQVKISTNGLLSFNFTSEEDWDHQAIPVADANNNLIAALWRDLCTGSSGGHIYFYDDVANNRVIIEYLVYGHFGHDELVETFEILLYANGSITLQYLNTSAETWNNTVGIEDRSGTQGVQIAHDATYIHNNLRVNISPMLSVNTWSGTVNTNSTNQDIIRLNAEALWEGDFSGNIVISSNESGGTQYTIPVNLHVNSAPSVGAPQNVTIQINGSLTQLSWDTVTGAHSYKVYASDSPDGTFTEVTSLGVIARNNDSHPLNTPTLSTNTGSQSRDAITRSRVNWSCDSSGMQRKFYYVTASNQ